MRGVLLKFSIYGFRKSFNYALTELRRKLVMELLRNSYSQQGEDLIIDRLLGFKQSGFYVDIGANDPHRFSNTKRFYKKGWGGINIEPDIANHRKFMNGRKTDINLNIGIGLTNSRLKFYTFIPDTLSTFSEKQAASYLKQGYRLDSTTEIALRPLSEVLSEYCGNRVIDILSIDTEGFDMQVLKSNDWTRFRPTLICIESAMHTMNGKNTKKEDDHEVFLENIGYERVYDNGLNSIYKFNAERNG